MDNPIAILIVIAIAGLAFYWLLKRFAGGKRRELSIEDRVKDIDDRRVTANGLRLWVEATALITPAEIAAIEEGLNDCFVKARLQNLHFDKEGNEIKGAPLSLKDYVVIVLGDTIQSPQDKTWCYRVTAENYRGTDYDLADGVIDGKILAAGQMLNDTSDNYIIVPDPGTTTEKDLEDLRRVSMYEAEHILLRACNYPRFLETSTHGIGEGHPLF